MDTVNFFTVTHVLLVTASLPFVLYASYLIFWLKNYQAVWRGPLITAQLLNTCASAVILCYEPSFARVAALFIGLSILTTFLYIRHATKDKQDANLGCELAEHTFQLTGKLPITDEWLATMAAQEEQFFQETGVDPFVQPHWDAKLVNSLNSEKTEDGQKCLHIVLDPKFNEADAKQLLAELNTILAKYGGSATLRKP